MPIAAAYREVREGYLRFPDAKVYPYDDTESEPRWQDIQIHTERVLAPHTRCDNYLHYTQRPSLIPSGWESSLSGGLIHMFIVDASEPNEDVKKKEYGTEKLLGAYTFYLEDLKDIDFHVIYPPDETFKKYWIAPPQ